MAKIKDSVKRNSATTKVKSSPLKATTGRVRKLRINIKDIKKCSDNSINKSIVQEPNVSSNSRSLLVKKFHQTRASNTQSEENNKNNNTLRGQCKAAVKNKLYQDTESKGTRTLIAPGKTIKFFGECITLTRAGRIGAGKNASKNAKGVKGNNITNDGAKILRSISFDINDDSSISINKTRSIRNCCVKVKRLPVQVGVKEVQQNKEHSTQSCSKSCVIRLQRVPPKNKSNISKGKTLTTKKCEIKLQRLPVDKKQNKPDEREEFREASQNSTNNTTCTLPVICNAKLIPTKSPIRESSNKKNNMNDITNSVKSTNKNNTALSNFKHLPKLSLKKTNKQRGKCVVLNFDTPKDQTLHFEPIRNSTLMEFGVNNKIKDKQLKEQLNNSKANTLFNKIFMPENLDHESKNTRENSAHNCRSALQNLVNKSDEIESILNSLDDDLNDENKNGVQDTTSPTKPKKFFHSKIRNLNEKSLIVDKPKAKLKGLTKKQVAVNKKRRFSTKRSSLMNRTDIYDFLSQSSTLNSDGGKHLDPTADIIKKLIDQGKVRVATNCKGKGKPMFKRKILHKKMKKAKRNAYKNRKEKIKHDVKSKTISVKEISNQEVEDNHFEDNFDHDLYDDDFTPDTDYNLDNMNKETGKRFKNNTINEQEGTFSRLARSVLVHQAGRLNLQKKESSTRLLEIVKKYISTPKNKQPLPETALHSDISPILIPHPTPRTKSSPWRVDEDANLPRIFNFSRSPANLPSFSSDYIPSTPIKKISRNSISKQHQPCIFSDNTLQCCSTLMENQTSLPLVPDQGSFSNNVHDRQISTQKEPSSISSFSSNDSNAENMPPSNMKSKENNKNDDIFNLKQVPNPRSVLTYRSPLKTINILEVIHLPPFKSPIKKNSKENTNDAVNVFGFKENILEKSLQTDENIKNIGESPQKKCEKIRNELPDEDLFGFEEFLSQNNEFSHEDNCINAEPNITIHEKLQDLRKLKPDDNDLQLSLVKEKSKYPFPLFENEPNSVEVDGIKQKNIKEMLCSTMINPQPSTSKNALKELKTRNLLDAKKRNLGEDSDLSELFKDPEPETTFNENEAHRTYVRPFKRKRRLKESKYIVFLESDESDDEEILKDHQKPNHSNEADTSFENNTKKKRQRKLPKENLELNEFVKEFNEMCKEVDSFELRVEKSA